MKFGVSDAIQRFATELMAVCAEPPQSIVFDADTFRRLRMEVMTLGRESYIRPAFEPEVVSITLATPAGSIVVSRLFDGE